MNKFSIHLRQWLVNEVEVEVVEEEAVSASSRGRVVGSSDQGPFQYLQ